jgi:predicted transposase/invertase (TIGR01784 family)
MSQPIGINPMVDFVFKLLLGSPEHAAVTIHFLRAILGARFQILSVEFRNPDLGKSYDDDKWVILDILVTDDQGRQYNIEMQTSIPAGLRQRLAFYLSRLYASQLKDGEQYQKLRPSIVICVLLEPLIAQVPELHREFQMRDLKGNSLTDDLQIHLLQLTYLQVTRENLATATPIERWAFFLLNAEQLSEAELRDLFPEPEFAEAIGVLKVINETPEKMHEYNARLKLQLDEAARMEFALEKGLQKGREEGEKKGRQEGELIGQIMILQELLSVTEPTRDELTRFEMSRLTELAEQLRLQLRTRGD